MNLHNNSILKNQFKNTIFSKMKKILFLVMLALSTATISNAQIVLRSSDNLTSDTLTNANTIYMTAPTSALVAPKNKNYRVSFRVQDNISGTSTFTVIQQGSMDGTTWFNMSGAALGTDGYCSDSLSVSSATDALQYTMSITANGTKYVNGTLRGCPSSRVLYYRLKFVGTGTQSTCIDRCYLYLVD